MKKQYSKPTVTKIALRYQQAVLAACSTAAAGATANNRSPFNCSATPNCRRSSGRTFDSAGTS